MRADRVSAPLIALPLSEDALVVALPTGHPLAIRQAVSMQDLVNEQMVMCPRRVSPIYHDHIIAACRGASFSPRGRTRSGIHIVADSLCWMRHRNCPRAFDPDHARRIGRDLPTAQGTDQHHYDSACVEL